MSLQADWLALDLDFAFEAVTSRERMWHKRTYLVRVHNSDRPDICGIGECGLFRGLSADDCPDYEDILADLCRHPQDWEACTMPSIHFGFETATRDLENGGKRLIYNSGWTEGKAGIPINGLIWMGDRKTMAERIDAKLADGFRVLKLKIGGINFDDECGLLAYIRNRYSTDTLEIRLDANGSFRPENALARLERLAEFGIHSIEQPLPKGMAEATADLCRRSSLPIALDEELIGWRNDAQIADLLDAIAPQYIILKPSLIGGFDRSEAYVRAAGKRGIGWWATSALESNVGLNAIAQWVASKDPKIPQGLGTGMLYTNNLQSPLYLSGDRLKFNPAGAWADFDALPWI